MDKEKIEKYDKCRVYVTSGIITLVKKQKTTMLLYRVTALKVYKERKYHRVIFSVHETETIVREVKAKEVVVYDFLPIYELH
jgi:hypothetical protein